MKKHIWLIFMIFGIVFKSYAVSDVVNNQNAESGYNDTSYVPAVTGDTDVSLATPGASEPGDTASSPLISISSDGVLDMNWAAALELTDPALRPLPVTLPGLNDYSFDNLEIKLRLLNMSF